MAQVILTNAKVYADQYDVSPYLNQLQTGKATDTHEVTPFGATSRRYAPGLQSGTFQFQGFTEFGTTPPKIEKIMANLAGTQDKALTVVPEGATAGNVSLFCAAAFQGYDFGGPHGNPNTFTWNGATSKWSTIGGFLEEPGLVVRSTTGNSTGQLIAAVSANQFLYAAVHVLTATGTADIVVESGTSGAFAAPTTRITFTQFTATGGQVARIAGPITDTFFRFKWTLAASPSFTIVGSIGIGI